MLHQYSPEFRARALRLLDTATETSEVSEFEAIKSVASKLGTPEESVRAPESETDPGSPWSDPRVWRIRAQQADANQIPAGSDHRGLDGRRPTPPRRWVPQWI